MPTSGVEDWDVVEVSENEISMGDYSPEDLGSKMLQREGQYRGAIDSLAQACAIVAESVGHPVVTESASNYSTGRRWIFKADTVERA